MTDLAAQILAALDRAEETARAASRGRWVVHDGTQWEASVRAISTGMTPGWRRVAQVSRLYDDAAHIAANDPAHVLRLCAALREVVKLHTPRRTSGIIAEPGETREQLLARWAQVVEADQPAECPTCLFEEQSPCPTLAALASVWDVPGVAE